MNDKLLLEEYLLILKSTVEVYVHGTLESSNKSVREVLKFGLDSTMSNQYETYNEMVNNNWYKVSNVNNKEIAKLLNKIEE